MKLQAKLYKGVRNVLQNMLRREAGSEPCTACWSYQPHRPETPLPQPKDKKKWSLLNCSNEYAPAASCMRRAFFISKCFC